ncbi:MAG: sigma-54-dependent Fis family transcriptional regulator [Planctomycetes bacterium]|nr:sigma-54-dependent Fis family transcriptional regulator [Planctomycetota bacterium]
MSRARILVVDDDPAVLGALEGLLSRKGGHAVEVLSSPAEALERLRAGRHDAALVDVVMPGMSGLELLAALSASGPLPCPILVMSAAATLEMAVQAMKGGAVDCFQKPYVPDDVLLRVERALEGQRLRDENRRLRSRLDAGRGPEALLGVSPAMARLREELRRLAPLDATVLVRGESGTGKELAARALHHGGGHRPGEFVVVDCAALRPELADSELYGHRAGAFTGADEDRAGLVARARGGTLYLDEVGDLAPEAQSRFLRLLQEGDFRPVGAVAPERLEARVVASTHRDLETLSAKGEFREDLYWRLKVVEVEVPPLRTRTEDLRLLVGHFLRELSGARAAATTVSEAALRVLAAHPWPGNVRQLRNVVLRALALGAAGELGPGDLPLDPPPPMGLTGPAAPPAGPPPSLEEAQARAVRHALAWERGNKRAAARRLGVSATTLYRMIERYRIEAASPPRDDGL